MRVQPRVDLIVREDQRAGSPVELVPAVAPVQAWRAEARPVEGHGEALDRPIEVLLDADDVAAAEDLERLLEQGRGVFGAGDRVFRLGPVSPRREDAARLPVEEVPKPAVPLRAPGIGLAQLAIDVGEAPTVAGYLTAHRDGRQFDALRTGVASAPTHELVQGRDPLHRIAQQAERAPGPLQRGRQAVRGVGGDAFELLQSTRRKPLEPVPIPGHRVEFRFRRDRSPAGEPVRAVQLGYLVGCIVSLHHRAQRGATGFRQVVVDQ